MCSFFFFLLFIQTVALLLIWFSCLSMPLIIMTIIPLVGHLIYRSPVSGFVRSNTPTLPVFQFVNLPFYPRPMQKNRRIQISSACVSDAVEVDSTIFPTVDQFAPVFVTFLFSYIHLYIYIYIIIFMCFSLDLTAESALKCLLAHGP